MRWLDNRRRRKAEKIAAGHLELTRSGIGKWEIRYWPHGKPCAEGCGYVIAWSSKIDDPTPYWNKIFEREVKRILDGWGYTSYYVHSIEGHAMPWPVEMTPEEIRASTDRFVAAALEHSRRHRA